MIDNKVRHNKRNYINNSNYYHIIFVNINWSSNKGNDRRWDNK